MTEMLKKEFSRGSFLKGGGAMVVGFSLAGAGLVGKAQSAESPFASNGPADPNAVDSYIMIHADNTASIKTGHVELGQGSGTGILMIAAEKLDLDMSQMLHVRHDTNVTPNTGSTGNDGTISRIGLSVRAAAVTARQELLKLAAVQLGVAQASLTVKDGVVSGGGKSVTYGQLLGDKLFNVQMPASYGMTQAAVSGRQGAGLQTGAPGTKPVSQYNVVGTLVPRVDIPAKVAGTYTYVHNVKVPGMIHGRVVRPRGQGAYPSGALVVSVDESSIKNLPNVQVVRRGDFIGVVAPREYDAIQGAAQLKVKWADPPKMAGSGNIWKQMREFDAAGQAPARILMDSGDVDRAFAAAAVRVNGTYMTHYAGHGPIGPLCAVADVTANGAVIFSNTQNGYGARATVSGLLKLPVNNVRVVYYEGSSHYGGGAIYDDVAGAAAVMSQVVAKPVRVQFTRWDDHGWDTYGLPLLADLRGAVDTNGRIVAYEYTAFAQPGTAITDLTRQLTGTQIPTPGLGTLFGAAPANWAEAEYVRPNRRLIVKSLPLFNNYLKLGALRGVSFTQEAFPAEQFIDELAYAAKMDPVEFRRKNLNSTDLGRWSSAFEAVVKQSKWQPRIAASELKSGNIVTGRGIALGTTDSTTRAVVVAEIEVNKKTGRILVKDIWGALNAGLAINPALVENQMIGHLVTGASRALYEQVRYDTKRVTSLDWVTYPTLRFKDSPRTHVVVLQWPNLQPTGVGEPTLIPVAAAIGNAFFDATGVRIREAPMTPARVRATLKAAGVA